MARPPRAVGLDRAGVVGRGALGLHQLDRLPSEPGCRLEEGAVGLLSRVREPPMEAVQEDRGPAIGQRKAVAPHPQREPERKVGGEQRIRPFARQERGRAGDTDHDRVKLAFERRRARLDAAEQRFGVRDRGRAAVGGRQ